MGILVQNIPEVLVYEIVDGQPIYYQGYMDYLNGNKQLEEIMGSSYLQSLIISKLIYFLVTNLDPQFLLLTNEVGLQLKEKKQRAADIAIVDTKKLKDITPTNKYLKIPPKVVIEIDTKADLETVQEPLSYFHKKTDDLLEFGVETVIWIFTDSKKIMTAQKDKVWQTHNWDITIQILPDLEVCIADLIA